MTHIEDPQSFTVVDPRTFEGDPFEVAERAAKQAAAVAALLESMMDNVSLMARNAELERALLNKVEDLGPVANGWDASPQGRTIRDARASAVLVKQKMTTLSRAAGFNPRKPAKV